MEDRQLENKLNNEQTQGLNLFLVPLFLKPALEEIEYHYHCTTEQSEIQGQYVQRS